MTYPLNWTDARVTRPTMNDASDVHGQTPGRDLPRLFLVSKNSLNNEIGMSFADSADDIDHIVDHPNLSEVFWATPPTDGALDAGGGGLTWTDQSVTPATAADAGPLFGGTGPGSSGDDLLFALFRVVNDGTPFYRFSPSATVSQLAAVADPAYTAIDEVYWAPRPTDEVIVCPPPASGPVYETDMEIFIIEEVLNGVPTILPQWDFTTEAFAQGYIDTFGAGRDLRIIHFVKVTDETRDDVPAGTPVVWICEKTVNDVHSYMGNPHLTQNYADFWTGIFGGPNATYNTRMLAEYTS